VTPTVLAVAFAVAVAAFVVCVFLGCLVAVGDAHRENEARHLS